MARSKTIAISQPMDAKHVGGVHVKGSGASSLDNYFNTAEADSEERSSPSPDASKKTEARGRSDSILSTPRRTGVSWKDSLSRLRQKSFSPHSRSRRGSEDRHMSDDQMKNQPKRRSSSTTPLKTQPSITRLGHSIGADSESDDPKSRAARIQHASDQLQQVTSSLADKKALARLTTTSSIYSTTTTLSLARKPLCTQHPSKDTTPAPSCPSPAKPKRADSGTAIAFDHVPAAQRPVPFREIMAVQSLQERMALYKKTREYWATADHGLGEWVERAVAPRGVVV